MVMAPAWKKAVLFGLVLISLPQLMQFFEGFFNKQTYQYQPISGPISNPLMGWAPWAFVTESKQPFTLVYADLTWRDFEPQRGVYDFEEFERRNQFTRWRAENKRVVFRFVCDRPGRDSHMDIPDWLYQAANQSGDWYNNDYGKGFSPDYTNPIMLKAHREALQALGRRYGKDPLFAYIELGSLGHWGEWHVRTTSGIRPLPPENIRDEYVKHYREAFPGIFLLMRRPFRIAKQMNLGLYNDMAGDPDGTYEWLDWITSGGDYDQTGEENALSAMPSAWRDAPVGGEQTLSMSHEEFYGEHLEETLWLLKQSHTTFIGPNSPYEVDPQSALQAGVDRVMERIGYRIYIKEVQIPSKVISTRWIGMPVSITFANNGIAPMYYPWPAQLYILDEAGNIHKTFQPGLDVRKIIPGKSYPFTTAIPINGLSQGKYLLGFAILDPANNLPAVRLAMENPREDGIQVLGTFDVTRSGLLLPE